MLIDKDFAGFFEAMMRLEINQRNLYLELSEAVDDPGISALMLEISHEEQTHMGYVQHMIDLVSARKPG